MILRARLKFLCLMLLALLSLEGCADRFSVPGGSDMVNQSFYTTRDDLLMRLGQVTPGMAEWQVFSTLGHNKDELLQLERDQVVNALYGTSNVEFNDGADSSLFLQSLYGYRLNYKIITRKHGFTSPIRIKTAETGFDYSVTLVFRNGVLYAPPMVTGGIVNRASSKTFFDYINPGAILDHAD